MKILIPLDGSKFAEGVLGPASQLGSLGKENVEVHLITAVEADDVIETWRGHPPVRADGGVSWGFGSRYFSRIAAERADQERERLRNEAKDYLEHIAHQFFKRSPVTKVVLGGEPAVAILAYARTEEFDLIAIATHGRTGFAGIIMGSVAQKLLKAYVAPVFMVRPKGLNETGSGAETSAGSDVSQGVR